MFGSVFIKDSSDKTAVAVEVEEGARLISHLELSALHNFPANKQQTQDWEETVRESDKQSEGQ